jgi:hypothetical protein
MSCDTSTVSAEINAALAALPDAAESAGDAAEAQATPLLDLVNAYPGAWVTTSAGDLPAVSTLLERITNLGAGLAEWRFREYDPAADRTLIILPGAVTAALTEIEINAVPLGPGDYSVSGDEITLAYALEYGDILTVRTYG